MKKFALLTAAIAMTVLASSCCSLRTPAEGKNSGKNYYYTFFGLSFESAVYGDGIIVNAVSNQ